MGEIRKKDFGRWTLDAGLFVLNIFPKSEIYSPAALYNRLDFNYFFIAVVAALFYFPFLGNVHLFDWDEINFAECAREAISTKNYMSLQINYVPFWEKPPLYIWLQILSMRLLGVNEYAARLPDALCGVTTLISVYHIGKKLRGARLGILWVLCMGCSVLPFLYFKSGIIDPWFNLFIFLSVVYFFEAEKFSVSNSKNLNKNLIFAGVFCGLAILTKGPVGYLIIGLTWFFQKTIYRQWSWLNIKLWIYFTLFSLATACIWFGVDILMNGTWFVKTFIEYNLRLAKTEDAGHGGFFGYHFVVLLLGCFPMSIFGITSFFGKNKTLPALLNFTRLMKTLFWVVLILFSLVQSKIVHYSSLCYLPLSFLAATVINNRIDFFFKHKIFSYLLFGIGTLLAFLTIALPFIGNNITVIKPFFKKDIFAQANLEAAVYWSGWESLSGFFLLAVLILFFYLEKRNKISINQSSKSIFILFLGTALFVQSVLLFFVPNIEAYSQRAAIEFYESKSSEHCVIETYGFKSYAHLFYARKQPPSLNSEKEAIVYVVGKIQNKKQLDENSDLEFLYAKNGFIFYRKK